MRTLTKYANTGIMSSMELASIRFWMANNNMSIAHCQCSRANYVF